MSSITELAVARRGRKAWKQEHLLEEKISAFGLHNKVGSFHAPPILTDAKS